MSKSKKQINIFRTFLKTKINQSELSLREIAQKSGVNHSYIWKIINNKIDTIPSPQILKKLSMVLPISYDELMNHADYISRDQYEIHVEDSNASIDPDQISGYSSLTDNNYLFNYVVTDNSMINFGILKNDVAVINEVDDIDSINNEIVLVNIEDKSNEYLRRININENIVVLEAANNKYETKILKENEITIVGKLKKIERYY